MNSSEMMNAISRGRTDLIFEFMQRTDWQETARQGPVALHSWLVYFDDVTALRALLRGQYELSQDELDAELGHAAFFGHWKVCDFLLDLGANAKAALKGTGETPLHNVLCKAGRPHFAFTVKLLLAHGADPNARTNPNVETGAFMRDVRTKGEKPLHRAAAFAPPEIVELLLEHGADRAARDCNGDTPLSWASWHLRPGRVLQLLTFPPHHISDKHVAQNTSDHGAGWGNAMERNFLGEYLPFSTDGSSW